MKNYDEISFVIPGFYPETMPLNRLIEYLQQMAVILGDPDDLHLVKISKSSVKPVFHVAPETAVFAEARAQDLKRGDGTRRQTEAFNQLRRMIRRDVRDAGRTALIKSSKSVILEIDAAPKEEVGEPKVSQQSSLSGRLVRLGGVADDIALEIQTSEKSIVRGLTTNRSLAKELVHSMWEPVRLHGVGQWRKNDDGAWSLKRMKVDSFERLEDETVAQLFSRMRGLKIDWPENSSRTLEMERE